MKTLLRSYGLELVKMTAGELNDARPAYVIREQGDTADIFSTYDRAEAVRRFDDERLARVVLGRTA